MFYNEPIMTLNEIPWHGGVPLPSLRQETEIMYIPRPPRQKELSRGKCEVWFSCKYKCSSRYMSEVHSLCESPEMPNHYPPSGLFGTTKQSDIELAEEMRKKQELVRLVR